MQRFKFWFFLLCAAVLAGTATRQFFAGNNLDGAASVLGAVGWFVLALRSLVEKSDLETLHAGEAAKASLSGLFSEAKSRSVERHKASWGVLLDQLRQGQNDNVVSVIDISNDEKCQAQITLSNRREVTLKPCVNGGLEVSWVGEDWRQYEPCTDIHQVSKILKLLTNAAA